MAEDAGGQEKTEEPTGKKLTDTRDEGKVAKSQEVNSIAIFGTGLILVFLLRDFLGNRLFGFARHIFSSLNFLSISRENIQIFIADIFTFIFVTLSPFFIALVIVGLATGYGQAGFKITPKALKPKFSKLNPIKGFKNKFLSTQPLVELGKSLFKFLILGLFAYWELSDSILFSGKLMHYSVSQIVDVIIESAFSFLWKMIIIYVFFAVADFAYQKFKFKKDIKMTKQEVKEENKNQEGDPLIKSRIKTKQIQLSSFTVMEYS